MQHLSDAWPSLPVNPNTLLTLKASGLHDTAAIHLMMSQFVTPSNTEKPVPLVNCDTADLVHLCLSTSNNLSTKQPPVLSCLQHYFSKLNACQTIYFFKPLNWNNYNCAAFIFPWIKCPPNNWTLQWIAFWLWYRAFLLSLFYINYN